jgi:dihydrofolate reductase
MGIVSAGFTMSLDGFIAGPNDDISRLFRWYGSGDTEFPVAGTDMVFRISQASADHLRGAWSRIGALVTGRHDFDVSGAWGGQPLQGWHTFIVTHNPPAEWTQPGSPFHFVTDGVESAIAQAQQAADGKDVAVGGTTIVQQALRAGLIDEISIELVPMLLGSGTRLFDHLEMHPTDLEIVRVIPTRDVTHLHYRVVKQPAG